MIDSINIGQMLEELLQQQWALLGSMTYAEAYPKINKSLEDFLYTNRDVIMEYAATLERPQVNSKINYLRHLICGNDDFMAMIHVFNSFGTTKIHNHKGSGLFLIPLTSSLEVCTYGYSEPLDVVHDERVQVLELLEQKPIKQYGVATHSALQQELVHKIFSVSNDYQMMFEIYIPHRGNGVYLPIYQSHNHFYYYTKEPLQINSHTHIVDDFDGTLSEDLYISLVALMKHEGYTWPIYLPDNMVVVDQRGLLEYLNNNPHAIARTCSKLKKIALV